MNTVSQDYVHMDQLFAGNQPHSECELDRIHPLVGRLRKQAQSYQIG